MSDEPEAVGWQAIDDALEPIYHGQEPRHYATVIPAFLGGKDPLSGISAYPVSQPVPHWHLITYGFSELYDKETDDPDVSGFGFELTMRLKRRPDEDEPPPFVLSFLQNLGRYVFESGNPFDVGHHIPLNGPICQGDDTRIWAVALATDPQLPPISTPNGRVNFLQVVGITMDELSAILAWDTQKFLELARHALPLLVTDLRRASLMENARFAEKVSAGIRRDGSSCGMLFASGMRIQVKGLLRKRATIVVGDHCITDFKGALGGRLGHGREFILSAEGAQVIFRPADQHAWQAGEGTLDVTLPGKEATEFARQLSTTPGRYPLPGFNDLTMAVEHVEIRSSV